MNHCYFFKSVIPGLFVNCRTSSNCVNMQIQSAAPPSLDPRTQALKVLKTPPPPHAASTNAALLGYCSLQHVRRLRYRLC